MTTPLGSASVMLPAAPRPRPPQPTRPTLILSLPAAWAKLAPSAAKVAAAAVAFIMERREREDLAAEATAEAVGFDIVGSFRFIVELGRAARDVSRARGTTIMIQRWRREASPVGLYAQRRGRLSGRSVYEMQHVGRTGQRAGKPGTVCRPVPARPRLPYNLIHVR